jgi:hypothetical protein
MRGQRATTTVSNRILLPNASDRPPRPESDSGVVSSNEARRCPSDRSIGPGDKLGHVRWFELKRRSVHRYLMTVPPSTTYRHKFGDDLLTVWETSHRRLPPNPISDGGHTPSLSGRSRSMTKLAWTHCLRVFAAADERKAISGSRLNEPTRVLASRLRRILGLFRPEQSASMDHAPGPIRARPVGPPAFAAITATQGCSTWLEYDGQISTAAHE